MRIGASGGQGQKQQRRARQDPGRRFGLRTLIGGYLSRMSHKRVAAIRRRPILAALMTLSEGRRIARDEIVR